MEYRAGRYVTNLSGDSQYKSFKPSPLPPNPEIKIDFEMMNLVSESNRVVGILEGRSTSIPNVDLFVAMYIRKEALLSSKIEGIQATLDDILDPDIDKNINLDVTEVLNYIKASKYGVERLKTLPLSNRFFKEIHQELMGTGRGSEKEPGEFRRSQNWIGPIGSTIRNARYIPPNVEDMNDALYTLESFINEDQELDPFIKIGLIHYQFETIHPFLDGNGRVGRLLILLFLIEKRILSHEVLYISYFLKRNRYEYYERLMEVRQNGNYEQWVKFFLRAVIDSASDALESIDKINQLHIKNKDLIENENVRSVGTFLKLLEYLEEHPIIDITKASKDLEMSYNTISSAVKKFVEMDILVQEGKKRRNKVFVYESYLQILRKDT
ncbi:MAG: Fic family protein [Bacillota bacterium]|nr:Fic family protein [Bacillota bacterium]